MTSHLVRRERAEAAEQRLQQVEAALRTTVTHLRHELFALCEDTENRCADVAANDLEGKQGAFARGRVHEAKGIRNAMSEVIRAALEGRRTQGGEG